MVDAAVHAALLVVADASAPLVWAGGVVSVLRLRGARRLDRRERRRQVGRKRACLVAVMLQVNKMWVTFNPQIERSSDDFLKLNYISYSDISPV